ncbi:hypothetical protein [uncultured Victivallis sp.]|uniref:hypothetical protein n=1 Tax=uncultured Victivallis sp. TaxID=354118 RepID=UPI0025FA2596|nr:hypothetical protein [uncultured Victivallis sp.]
MACFSPDTITASAPRRTRRNRGALDKPDFPLDRLKGYIAEIMPDSGLNSSEISMEPNSKCAS